MATELVQGDTGGIVEGDSLMEVVEGLDNREELAFANRTTSMTRSSNRLMAFIRTVNSLDGNAVPEGDDSAVEDAKQAAMLAIRARRCHNSVAWYLRPMFWSGLTLRSRKVKRWNGGASRRRSRRA